MVGVTSRARPMKYEKRQAQFLDDVQHIGIRELSLQMSTRHKKGCRTGIAVVAGKTSHSPVTSYSGSTACRISRLGVT